MGVENKVENKLELLSKECCFKLTAEWSSDDQFWIVSILDIEGIGQKEKSRNLTEAIEMAINGYRENYNHESDKEHQALL